MNKEPANESTREVKRRERLMWIAVALLLALQFILGCDAAGRLTPTHDEYWHLPVGLLNLKTGRFDLDNLNPPLMRMWAALPLFSTSAGDIESDYHPEATGYGDAFVQHAGQKVSSIPQAADYKGWFQHGRVMVLLLTVATGLVLAIWSRQMFGCGAAVLTTLLWVTCPNILAHGSLVTTDLGAAAFFVFVSYAAWKHAHRPTWSKAVLWGTILGLAQLAKYTCVLLYPVSLVIWIVCRVRNREAAAANWKRSALQGVTVCAVSLVVLNAGYLFHGSFTPLSSYKFQSAALSDWHTKLGLLGRLPVPLPRDYLQGLDRQKQIMESPHPVYLDGEWNIEGFSNYYLMAMFYKLPHPLQLLFVCVVLFLVSPASVNRSIRTQSVVLLPAFAMLTAAGAGGMQLGIRYVLPVLPFLMLFAGQGARWWDWKRARLRTVVVAILALVSCVSLRYHPHHLAYFNELAGGPVGGRAHLLDSNLDWGQDLDGLKSWMDTNNQQEIGLAYFGTVPPASLGIRYRVPPSRVPQPGWYAVSVNFVMGRPHVLRDETGKFRAADINEFAYFQFFEPAARIGYSIDVYHLTQDDVNRWHAALQRAGMR